MAHRIVEKQQLSENVFTAEIEAPLIAKARKPGQFVIVRHCNDDERIPLTIADADPKAGTITLIIQAVGPGTQDIVATPVGGAIRDVAGPLGRPRRRASPPRRPAAARLSP